MGGEAQWSNSDLLPMPLCARIEGDIPKVRATVETQRPDHTRRRPYEKLLHADLTAILGLIPLYQHRGKEP